MARFYFKYTPVRRGLTGFEFMGQYVDSYHNNCVWNEIINDGLMYYGYLSGEGDSLSKCIQSIEGRFSSIRLTENSFIGEIYPIFISLDQNNDLELIEPITFEQLLINNNIFIDNIDILACVKEFKANMFKEISKKRFYDDNDSIADLSKSVVLITMHYPNLSTEQKQLVDAYINGIKQIYTPEVCIHGFTSLVDSLNSVLSGYYTAKSQLESAETVEEVLNVVYE